MPGAAISGECVSAPPSSSEDAVCTATETDSVDTQELDRITTILLQHVDPDAVHTGDSMMAGGSMSADNVTTAVYAGTDWSDGDLEGAVSLSVEDTTAVGSPDGCSDESIAYGPRVTCEQQTLADGSTVLVGHGVQDGAERVSVRFDRPDGNVVIATADAATEQWWTDQTGPAPLPAPPQTVDQLIDLVLDPGNHL